ncbi:MAG: type II toxin-antitoxin system RelB/DinJ family antitoxin [Clostridiales Family XIII bacterium]|jgi:DNA-damage-inducible protein J|nr:type II toxin-antitoxin system RelB/DinJ family antitoxin [Clostridiales Family XIII bacterium]
MPKDTTMNIRIDSELKAQSELVLSQLGLNIATVVNMLFHQIVREQAVPLTMSLRTSPDIAGELQAAKAARDSGYVGRTAHEVAADMERAIAEAQNGKR